MDVTLHPCTIVITTEDRDKADNAIKIQELKKTMKPCSVVIWRRTSITSPEKLVSSSSSSSAANVLLPPAFKPIRTPTPTMKRERSASRTSSSEDGGESYESFDRKRALCSEVPVPK